MSARSDQNAVWKGDVNGVRDQRRSASGYERLLPAYAPESHMPALWRAGGVFQAWALLAAAKGRAAGRRDLG